MRIRNFEFVKRYDKRKRERGEGRFLDGGIHVGKKRMEMGRLWECNVGLSRLALRNRQIERLSRFITTITNILSVM